MPSRGAGQSFKIAALALCVGFVLTGCQSAKVNLEPAQVNHVQAGRKSLVLFQIVNSPNDREPAHARRQVESVTWQSIPPENAPPGTNTVAPRRHTRTFGRSIFASRREGWRVLPLMPGDYLVSLAIREMIHTSDNQHRPAAVTNTPPFWLTVPPGESVVYGGSFEFKPVAIPTRNRFGSTESTLRIEPRRAPDQSAAALQVGREIFAELGAFLPTMPASTNDLRTAIGRMPAKFVAVEEIPTAVPFVTNARFGETAGMIAGGSLLLPGMFMIKLADHSDEEEYDYDSDDHDPEADLAMVAGGLVLTAAAVPVLYLARFLSGPIEQRKWAAQEAAFKEELREFNFSSRLAANLKEYLVNAHEFGTNTPLVLQVEIYRLGLRPGSALALEVAVRMKILNAATRESLWERGFIHAGPEPARLVFPYEQLAASSSSEHPLKDFKGQSGVRLFREELENALAGLTGSIEFTCQQADLVREKPEATPAPAPR